eukprot:GHRQ01034210.1.p1 GENE.GHRQ01034210.1~~GHRQ01034210.1.p1  ORF type:complete len:178 (-),score=33.47 GHRQ01034210.1:119-652(-)
MITASCAPKTFNPWFLNPPPQMFRRKKWKYLILDEAHMIKNWKSQRWQTLLRFNSKRRLLITGTPLQVRCTCVVALLLGGADVCEQTWHPRLPVVAQTYAADVLRTGCCFWHTQLQEGMRVMLCISLRRTPHRHHRLAACHCAWTGNIYCRGVHPFGTMLSFRLGAKLHCQCLGPGA